MPLLKRFTVLGLIVLFATLAQAVQSNGRSAAASHARELNANWQFRAIAAAPPDVIDPNNPADLNGSDVMPAAAREWHNATVPGVVQTDLLANKIIPAP